MADAVLDLASLDTGTETTETPAVDAGVVSTTETPTQDSQQQSTGAETVPDKAIRDAVRALSQTSPEYSKALKQMADAYYREGTAWKTAFDTPQKASEAKSIIESAGGIEGIAQSQERLRGYDAQDEGIKTGNPEVIESLFKDFPEGAAGLAPHYLAKLEATNPQALQAAVGPYAVQMLEQAGIMGHVEAMLKETDPARVKGMAETLSGWLKGQKQNADLVRQGGRQAPDPRADKIKARETELNQKEEKIFRDGVTAEVNSTVKQPLTDLVEQYAKQYKLNDTQKAHYRKTLEQSVIEEMNNDQAYLKQAELRNANKGRTTQTVAQFISSEFSRRAKDKAFEVAKAIYGVPRGTSTTGTGVVKAGTPQTSPTGGPLKISARPSDSQLDLNRPGADILLIQGRGYLKDGRFVTWR